MINRRSQERSPFFGARNIEAVAKEADKETEKKERPLLIVVGTGRENKSSDSLYGSTVYYQGNRSSKVLKKKDYGDSQHVTFEEGAGFELTDSEKGRVRASQKRFEKRAYANHPELKGIKKLNFTRNPLELHIETVGKIVRQAKKKNFDIVYVPDSDSFKRLIYEHELRDPSQIIIAGHWREGCVSDIQQQAEWNWPKVKLKLIIGSASVPSLSVASKNCQTGYDEKIKNRKIKKITFLDFMNMKKSKGKPIITVESQTGENLFTRKGMRYLKERIAKNKIGAKEKISEFKHWKHAGH